jgi:hypothetical protein
MYFANLVESSKQLYITSYITLSLRYRILQLLHYYNIRYVNALIFALYRPTGDQFQTLEIMNKLRITKGKMRQWVNRRTREP